MRVVHATWSDRALHLWAEEGSESTAGGGTDIPGAVGAGAAVGHPFAVDSGALAEMLGARAEPVVVTLNLPSIAGVPMPSSRLLHPLAHALHDSEVTPTLATFTVPAVRVRADETSGTLERLDEMSNGCTPGASVRFFAAATRALRHLLSQHRFVPSLEESQNGELRAMWQVWLGDAPTVERLSKLLAAMPPSARCAVDQFENRPWPVLEDFLLRVGDAQVRAALQADNMAEAIEGRDAVADSHVAWLRGLLDGADQIDATAVRSTEIARGVRRWIGLLEDRGAVSEWRLLLRLAEPLDVGDLKDLASPGTDLAWTLSFHLQSVENPRLVVDAADVWLLASSAVNIGGRCIENPQELLLAELGRASRLYRPIERALAESEPAEIDLNTAEAYQFLREVRPILREQGLGAEAPPWWDSPTVRLGARLQVDSEEVDWAAIASDPVDGIPAPSSVSRLGLSTLVAYRWKIAVGDTDLTLEQFERLAAMHTPLVRLGGRWVEIRSEDVRAAMDFLKKNPGGRMELGQALRLAYGSDVRDTGVPVLGMDATGWVGSVFGDGSVNEKLPMLPPPASFVGTLRPYQLKGFSWLAFLDRFGFGGCLADDMGLGKTIQLLALLTAEREGRPENEESSSESGGLGPSLLIVPMSVVGNWVREARRFTPRIRVLVHHGMDRNADRDLRQRSLHSDLVITTYALAHRDRALLSTIGWSRVVLDEAQNIKNPSAKQTQAIRSIPTPRRVALTGTPVENRLAELWSIMDFLNPAYLGSAGDFRKRYAVPVERYRDPVRSAQLRGLVQPFILRRLKSDPNVIADLPEKVESKEYCFLTPEQASLYERTVADMLAAADRSEGIQRRGVVLAGLIKLKQICNHPAQFLKEHGSNSETLPDASRSGKCHRLLQMLEEIVATGDRALIFTQFRQMGHILESIVGRALDQDILFLHGGTPSKQREDMVANFQKPDGRVPVFILSLKAGGVGLNLTGANHIFHFDRWWNPAVEAQATDRAYRIGQTRTVQVHKFIVSGTLEERIDQMIESKIALADQVIGSGEEWLTEMSTNQLREMLALRQDAVAVEDEA